MSVKHVWIQSASIAWISIPPVANIATPVRIMILQAPLVLAVLHLKR